MRGRVLEHRQDFLLETSANIWTFENTCPFLVNEIEMHLSAVVNQDQPDGNVIFCDLISGNTIVGATNAEIDYDGVSSTFTLTGNSKNTYRFGRPTDCNTHIEFRSVDFDGTPSAWNAGVIQVSFIYRQKI